MATACLDFLYIRALGAPVTVLMLTLQVRCCHHHAVQLLSAWSACLHTHSLSHLGGRTCVPLLYQCCWLLVLADCRGVAAVAAT